MGLKCHVAKQLFFSLQAFNYSLFAHKTWLAHSLSQWIQLHLFLRVTYLNNVLIFGGGYCVSLVVFDNNGAVFIVLRTDLLIHVLQVENILVEAGLVDFVLVLKAVYMLSLEKICTLIYSSYYYLQTEQKLFFDLGFGKH